jgi:hypothetical protein
VDLTAITFTELRSIVTVALSRMRVPGDARAVAAERNDAEATS